MKKKLFLALIISLITIISYSQNSNKLSAYYGFSSSELIFNKSVDGAGSQDPENINEFGLRYSRKVSKNIQIETGFNYFETNVKITPVFIGTPVDSYYKKLEVISFPININYSLGKFLFVNGGPILDFHISDNSIDSQSGIGYNIGIGGKYDFNNISIFINPNYKIHAFIPFKNDNIHRRLHEIGIQIGLGYKF